SFVVVVSETSCVPFLLFFGGKWVPKYLFVFGYESPAERKTNAEQGTDFESSNAVWVVACSSEQALEAGRRFADHWVSRLFHAAGINDYEGWTAGNFANWIEEQPLDRFSGIALDLLDEIVVQ